MTSTRQLAAIMFTDIVGYTALMGKDEPKAMEMVRKNREVQKPLIEKYGGALLKEMGDGNLASFPTASDAIYCAKDIQQALYNDKELNLRIGIHLGEIRMEGGDIYGDGVNVASRLETIADPGGIYISDTVQKSIRSQPDIQTAYLGELALKNVDYPVKTYALRGEFLSQPKKTEEKNLSGTLLAELHRRNVLRATLAYLAVAFIIYSLLKFADLSTTLQNVIYGILIVGIPTSLYLAWNFEKSPEGFVRVTSRKAWINPYSNTQKKPFTGNAVIIVLLVIIAGIVAFPKYFPNANERRRNSDLSSTKRKSIAVLPFENLSNDPEQAYFSDGIQEDILNQLAKIAELKVKSRSSTLRYRKDRPSVAQMGADLGVGVILEGSVRKVGNMVRISAQLIDVETDNHIWSETYDRELTEIFAIQSEVARKIATILELKLSADRSSDIFKTGTENITAYDYYLRARELYSKTLYYDNKDGTIKLLQQAISLDPNFAEAYALLSRALNNSLKLSRKLWLDSALSLANKAIELAPDISDGYVARALISDGTLGDNAKAGQDFEKAFALDPNNPLVLRNLGHYLIGNGDANRGVPMVIKSIDLNLSKKDPEYYLQWGIIYENIGEFDRAQDLILQAKKLAPDWDRPNLQLGYLYTEQHNYQKALENYIIANDLDNVAWSYYRAGDLKKAEEYWLMLLSNEKELEDSTSYLSGRQRLGMIYWNMGDKQKAMKYFNEQIRLNQNDIDRHQISVWSSLAGSRYDLAVTKAYMGKTEEALELIEHEDIFWGGPQMMSRFMDADPMLDPVRKDPRFIAVTDRLRSKAEAARQVFRRIIREREASEQLKIGLEK